jgi:hypothetical protein
MTRLAVIDIEARVVRQVDEHYTMTGWRSGAITRWLKHGGRPDTQGERGRSAR